MSRRTLVIGLGSTGSDMVDLLLRDLHAIDGSLDSFSYVHVVKIDTAKVSPRYVDGKQVRVIQMHEYVDPNSNLVWEDYLTRNEFRAGDWLTQQACSRLRDLDLSKGAGNNRLVGQFGLVMAAKAIIEQLTNVLWHLSLVTSVTSQDLSIFVVGFSGGGTCSGGLVTLLESVQHAVSLTAMDAKVYVMLSVPHIHSIPIVSSESVYVPNTVGLLQSLGDSRALLSYESLASTYQSGLLPNGKRSLVYNENYIRLAHLVSIVQPANASDTSSATQSVSDVILAQILGASDVIGDSLVNTGIQSSQLNIFTTKRVTYPRQEIAEGLLATAMDQALVLWSGSPEATANVVGVTENILKFNDGGKHFGDIFGMIRIAIDTVVLDYRLRLQSLGNRIGRANEYRQFIDNTAEFRKGFLTELDIKLRDTSELADSVITDLLYRIRESMTEYPSVGFSKLLRQAILAIDQVLDSPNPIVSLNKLSTTEIEEIATDLSMQLNPVFRESSYRAATQDYLSQLDYELGDHAVAYLLGFNDFVARFRLQLRRDLTELRHRIDSEMTRRESLEGGVQFASLDTVVTRLQAWTDNAKETYWTLGRPNPTLLHQVDGQLLQRLIENTNLAEIYNVKLIDDLIYQLKKPWPIGLDEVDRVVASIIEPKVHYFRENQTPVLQPGSLDSLLINISNPRTREVPFIPTQYSNIRTFRFTANPDSGGQFSIPKSAETVIELTFATDIPLDNLSAFTLSSTWADALKGIREGSPDYDKYRTIYPSNQLGVSDSVKLVSQFADTRQSELAEINGQERQTRGTQRVPLMTQLTPEKSIFISYRRDDSRDTVGRIYDRLSAHYGVARVIRDIDSLPIGRSFPDALDEAVTKAAVTIVVIGQHWASICDDNGISRLTDPEDFVRREIIRAMDSGKPVVPILVSEAKMPKRHDVPEPLNKLLDQHGIQVRPDPDFHKDMDSLIRSLNRILT